MSLAAQDPYWLFPAYSGYFFPLGSHSSNVAPAPLQSGCKFYSTIFILYSKTTMKKITAKKFEEVFNNGELKVLNCWNEVKFLICTRTRSEDKIQALRAEIEEKERFLFTIQDPLDRRSLEREVRALEFELKKALGFWSERPYKLVLRDSAQEAHLVEVLEQSHWKEAWQILGQLGYPRWSENAGTEVPGETVYYFNCPTSDCWTKVVEWEMMVA